MTTSKAIILVCKHVGKTPHTHVSVLLLPTCHNFKYIHISIRREFESVIERFNSKTGIWARNCPLSLAVSILYALDDLGPCDETPEPRCWWWLTPDRSEVKNQKENDGGRPMKCLECKETNFYEFKGKNLIVIGFEESGYFSYWLRVRPNWSVTNKQPTWR